MPTMLILRGNRGQYENEEGKPFNYTDGALHEEAAKKLAKLKGFDGQVLPVSGSAKPPAPGQKESTRDDSPQTVLALSTFRAPGRSDITAFYGFSGGGYNLWWILKQLTKAERSRIDLIVVVGVDGDRPQSDYEKSKFDGAHWALIYRPNHPKNHMFEPEALLKEEEEKERKGRVRFSPMRVRGHH